MTGSRPCKQHGDTGGGPGQAGARAGLDLAHPTTAERSPGQRTGTEGSASTYVGRLFIVVDVVDVTSEAKVRDLHHVVLRHQHVPGGQVSVYALRSQEGKRDGSEEGGAQGRVRSRPWARSPRRPSPTPHHSTSPHGPVACYDGPRLRVRASRPNTPTSGPLDHSGKPSISTPFPAPPSS